MAKKILISIDLTKLDKSRLITGKKGIYGNFEVWINDTQDQFGNDCAVKQTYKNGDKYESHYVGNGKKSYGWEEKKTESEQTKSEPESDKLPF